MSCVRNGWGNSLILFIVLIGTVRSEGGFVCSDLITPHCDGGVINLWEVLWLTRQAQPPPPLEQSSSVPTDNTNKQRQQKRSRENSRQCDLHDLSLLLQTQG